MTWKVSPDVERFDDALDWFGKRTVMTRADSRELDARARVGAFWIGGGLQLDQIQHVFDQLNVSLARGDSFETFRASLRGKLLDRAHLETVFRNAAQSSYNAGRYFQIMAPDVRRFRPYGMVDSILDGRTTVYCRSLDKKVVALDDPWWETHWFPAHHRCRTGVRTLRKAEAERRGITSPAPDLHPPAGWGLAPVAGEPKPFKPEPKRHEPTLVVELKRKATTTPARKPAASAEHEPATWTTHYAEQYGDAAEAVGWGRAALERGLDMPLADVEAQLRKLGDIPHVKAGLERVAELRRTDAKTMREGGAQLDHGLRALSGIAGHLEAVPERAAVEQPTLRRSEGGKRALSFFSKASGPEVVHPVDWTFRKIQGRASASLIEQRIKWSESPGVLEHEWGHALEALNPTLLKRAVAFLQARTRGERLEYLSDLMNNPSYGRAELARPDGFIVAYAGKHYESRAAGVFATELTSMGLELVVAGRTHWGTLEQLLRHDPEHFFFVLGQLKGP